MLLRRTALAACLGVVLLMFSGQANAQYELFNAVSNQLGQAPIVDPLLANPWGLARSASSPWWIADNDTGWSTVYDGPSGAIVPLKVAIPTAGNGPVSPMGGNGPGQPTGIVYNGSKTDFQVQGSSAPFIFATLDGTISAWAPGVNKNMATLAIDNSASKASYTGLAITSNASGNFLYAADNANNQIDMYDGSWNLVGTFSDPNAPTTMAVFGIQDINGLVYVTYAVPGAGAGGLLDEFKEDGTFVKTLVNSTRLNQAWGIAAAPSNFGPLSNTLLVSNNSVNGNIVAFDPVNGQYVGAISDKNGKQIILHNLWGIAFGGGTAANGAATTLFVTAGPGIGGDELIGTFAKIVFSPVKPSSTVIPK